MDSTRHGLTGIDWAGGVGADAREATTTALSMITRLAGEAVRALSGGTAGVCLAARSGAGLVDQAGITFRVPIGGMWSVADNARLRFGSRVWTAPSFRAVLVRGRVGVPGGGLRQWNRGAMQGGGLMDETMVSGQMTRRRRT